MSKTKKFLTCDGNQAAAHISYMFSEVAAIYPITPSSTMAEYVDDWSAAGRKNIFGETVHVQEMQSEAGAAGAVHGSLQAGALTTTYTASQGLLLMIPNMYKIAGELLPCVFHVSARTLASHALSIFGDHQDVMSARQTGFAMFCEGSVQEVMDLAAVAHLSAIRGRVPFVNFFDGFRTSHEIQKIEALSEEDLAPLLDRKALEEFRAGALSPDAPVARGMAENPDVFFQHREASNRYYEAIPEIVEEYVKEMNRLTGRNYGLFDYYGDPEADRVIIAMGSVTETIKETIDYLRAGGEKVGLVAVHLYRPFSARHFLAAVPASVRRIAVLDRTKEPGANGEPLYLDVRDCFYGRENAPMIIGGRYGLSSKDTTPAQILEVYRNLAAETPKNGFTIGIEDDVTNLSLATGPALVTTPEGTINCKFWGLGADGTVGANKNSIKIIGDNTDMFAQAYFDYDSKKSRGLTVSHLRFSDSPIRSPYLVRQADFVACHNPAYLHKYNMVQEVKDGGIFLLNCYYKEEELEQYLPGQVKRYIAQHKIKLYVIDAIRIGKEIGLNNKISTILQAAFFRLANIIPIEDARRFMKEAAAISYRKKGDKVVQMNWDAIDRGIEDILEIPVPPQWKQSEDEPLDARLLPDRPQVLAYVENIQKPVTLQQGNSLPVSAFLPYVDGSFPSGSSAHERRNVATEVPEWRPENCIQCCRCSFVCPHAVIRPAAMNEEEQRNAPEGMKTLAMLGMPGYSFSITVSETDCTGCGSCAGVCPGKQGEKALVMQPVKEHEERQQYFDYGKSLPVKADVVERFHENTVKGSQFKQPMLEFHGACAGCGETPYAILVTRLFGERMYIANATGCSSIWPNSSPTTAYTANSLGRGPAWSNSLFEDAAEFGYGMVLAQNSIRKRLKETAGNLLETLGETNTNSPESILRSALELWLDTFTDGRRNTDASDALIAALQVYLPHAGQENSDLCGQLWRAKDFLSKKSQWIFGGDGWAYDIGFGGLDHVLASGEDINILVFDTEVYSNTGGQASKATPVGSTAKFASGGKTKKKKDLASMAMTYGDVYVAQIAMGADYLQTIKAITEAEAYPGPSLIIAYSPCISHGIRSGMGSAQHEEAKAVSAGYWHLFRFDPSLEKQGKNPFQLDSRQPSMDYEEFLSGENRYNVLQRMHPDAAKTLFAQAAECAEKRFQYFNKLIDLYGANLL